MNSVISLYDQAHQLIANSSHSLSEDEMPYLEAILQQIKNSNSSNDLQNKEAILNMIGEFKGDKILKSKLAGLIKEKFPSFQADHVLSFTERLALKRGQLHSPSTSSSLAEKTDSKSYYKKTSNLTLTEKFHETNMDKWISTFDSKFTIDTLCFPISVETAKALMQAYTAKKNQEEIDDEIKKALKALGKRIDEKLPTLSTNVMVKLSGRSPKDVPINTSYAFSLFDSYVNQHSHITKNVLIRGFHYACKEAMRVTSGEEAVKLLVQSERVYTDLKIALEAPLFDQSIILRKWEEIPLYGEFRCFVNNNNLTAISQYFSDVYFEELDVKREEIKNSIEEFIKNRVISKVDLTSFIVDLAWSEKGIKVIELNTFYDPDFENLCPDSLLFDWNKDAKGLTQGPLEFRYITHPVSGALIHLPDNWKEHIQVKFQL